ncbi:MAG: NAD(+) synthase [Chloroflexi bacterium]|nr:NAD(+) synthase [Chloroflexota bacterium]MBM3173639.1 NAD(+) synthase [Chloroflexota bacterium]MBM3175995.1 NAD(+) synthase [Chloroflexota bacterium]MBM4449790.1 NAD(+) synthase [Chloroflexota bacterium]
MSFEKLARKITSWIKDTVSAAGGKGVVVGLSGGVDSAVVAVLCKRAFADSTLGVIMPCHSDETDRGHAELFAKKFGIPVEVVILDDVYDSLLRALPVSGYDEATRRLAEANIKPRLRMITLYYFANRLNYMVVGTSNRSELAVGYFTKYGDGGSDLVPLGSLVKQQVRDLAAYLDVPQEIIDKPPSGGLWWGQTDEGEMGLTYGELDRYLLTGEAQESVKRKIDSMMQESAHKRCMPSVFSP